MSDSTGAPLAGLDDVDWANLEHAYGPADDVPDLLRALASESASERGKAMHALYGNIFHQGSRYEATAHAVPFLAALADDPRVRDRAGIVLLLSAIAVGYDESYLPRGVEIAEWRAGIERMRAADPDEELHRMEEWVAAADEEGERSVRETRLAVFDLEESLRHAEAELGAYDAVRATVPTLRGLLGDPDPEIRAAAAYALGWFPEEAAGTLPALRPLLAPGAAAEVAANAIVSAGLLGGHDLVPSLRTFLTGEDALLRHAAAIALARLDDTGPDVLDTLEAAATQPPEHTAPGVHHLDGNMRGYATMTLAEVEEGAHPRLLGAMLKGLALSSGPEAFPTVDAVLRHVFGQPGDAPRPPFEELTEPQQRTVRTLAEMGDDTWRWGNFTLMLSAWGLPSRQADCRAYAGLD
ncbi:HEAT repeat domain-containing protein [Actinomadura sp. KC216]|uniref:HEAT repeat domain-containing protein n=1 Tax=Actinomadura sp. KC216 TaxID=2530370 RepID=UPI0010452C37|nr:HEAT repeat domain-containing protein [Actinomadura sp. KC216]TDB76129.1 HEAT repeat domain-containing protein [Actinomadura sp. KC216]